VTNNTGKKLRGADFQEEGLKLRPFGKERGKKNRRSYHAPALLTGLQNTADQKGENAEWVRKDTSEGKSVHQTWLLIYSKLVERHVEGGEKRQQKGWGNRDL